MVALVAEPEGSSETVRMPLPNLLWGAQAERQVGDRSIVGGEGGASTWFVKL